jgi:hypothetical protein
LVLDINMRTIFLAESLSSADSLTRLTPFVQNVFACLVALIPAAYRTEQRSGAH